MKQVLSLIFFVLFLLKVAGQETTFSRIERIHDLTANDLFFSQNYGSSAAIMEKFLSDEKMPFFQPSERTSNVVSIDQCIALLRINSPDAEYKVKKLINENFNKAEFLPLILELASYYYNAGKYDDALDYYSYIEDAALLSDGDLSEVSFKKGYSYFISQKFHEAKKEFTRTKELRNQYYYPSNYYYGMCQYFDNDYNGAVESFKRAANSDLYANQIPYFLCQIYFVQKDFDKLISYGEQKISAKNTDNVKDIRLLLGQAYYQKGEYERSLTHLEYYEANTEKLSAEEFYQLAFTQYKLDKCEKAKNNFLELTNVEGKMGQLANYYLADCLIKTGDKTSARAAFKKVSAMDFDLSMKEEALFNYGKISAELGSDREAINVLMNIDDNSRFYSESQKIINDILSNSGDYVNSIKIIESLPKLSESIKKTYQNLSLRQGIQYYQEGNFSESKNYLERSLKNNLDRNYTSQALYWISQIDANEFRFEESIKKLEEYFEMSNGLSDLPEESSPYIGHYAQGYNYLRKKEYKKAELQFKNSIVGININREDIKNDYILNRILPDAFIRAGDCLFKSRDFDAAKSFYDQAISRKQGGYVYAMYQKGLIEGLRGEFVKKLETMSEIVTRNPQSEFCDDAFVQMGETHLALGDREAAAVDYINLLSKYGRKTPYYNTGQMKLGLINYNRGDFNKALYYYKSVVTSDPSPEERIEALTSIQEIYIENMANSAAYLKYLDSLPNGGFQGISIDSLTYHLAYTLFGNNQYEASVASFGDYLSSYPTGYYKNDARYHRAEANNVLKEYGKSLMDYEAIVADGPGKYYQRSVYKASLIAYNFTTDFEKSLRYYKLYETLTDDVGEVFEAQFGALKSAFKLSRENDIIAFGEKVVSNAASTREEKASAYYYLGKTYYKMNNTEKAIATFDKMEKLINNNQSAEARYTLAEIQFKSGNVDQAEKQINYANEKNNNYPYWIAKGLMLLSDVYVSKSDLLNARAALEAVIENFKDDAILLTQANAKLEELKLKEKDANRIKPKTDKIGIIEKNKVGGDE